MLGADPALLASPPEPVPVSALPGNDPGEGACPRRPALRWHGGKWILAPWIISHFPAHRVYVEPFGGAASVLVRKPRAYAEVYNDLDSDVVNLFRVLRSSRASELIAALTLTPFAREEFIGSYEDTHDPVEKARRLIVRSFMGFWSNGHNIRRKTGFRANSNRSGTTPAHDWANYPSSLAALVERLRGVAIESRDAVEVMAAHDGPDTLHYVDPPYLPETRSIKNKYDLKYAGGMYFHEMDVADHRTLLAALCALQGKVILSGYPSPMYEDALAGWTRIERPALADGARKRTEVLWLNFEAGEKGLFAGLCDSSSHAQHENGRSPVEPEGWQSGGATAPHRPTSMARPERRRG